ncbi:hypothetical protein CDAR_489781 [Caerostris darwini]|uniref:Uncharacterized protein n=1 Tax=Caerostris darwini TaxID=1538125 RepID=A0AAV4ST49_9ARAC|nr:hypothetical protein CDAR_489781 [Caerostris darwini]
MAVPFHKQSPYLFFSGSDKSESTADFCPLSSGARKCTSRKRRWRNTYSPHPLRISQDTREFGSAKDEDISLVVYLNHFGLRIHQRVISFIWGCEILIRLEPLGINCHFREWNLKGNLLPSGSDKSGSTADFCPLSSGARKCTSRKRRGGGGRNTYSPHPLRISQDTSDFHLRACTGQVAFHFH